MLGVWAAPGAPGAPGDPCKGWGGLPYTFGMLACIYALRTWTDTRAAKTCPYTLRSWTATLESSDRDRGTVDDNGTNFQQLASRTRASRTRAHPGPRAGACIGQSTEGKTVTCKKMLCNLTD